MAPERLELLDADRVSIGGAFALEASAAASRILMCFAVKLPLSSNPRLALSALERCLPFTPFSSLELFEGIWTERGRFFLHKGTVTRRVHSSPQLPLM